MTCSAFAILVLVVWKRDFEVRNKGFSFCGHKERFAKTGKRKARSISRAWLDVAIRTDPRRGPFAREELPAMAVDARLMIGKLGNIGKGVFANGLPVLRREFVAGLAFEPVPLVDV